MLVYCIGVLIGLITHIDWGGVAIKEVPTLELSSLLKNNFESIMLTLSGSILFGFTTAQNLIFNGILLALIIRMALLLGVSLEDILILVLPHGIFEIPAIIAGAAVLNPVRNNQIFSRQKGANTDKRRHQRILNLSINLHSAKS